MKTKQLGNFGDGIAINLLWWLCPPAAIFYFIGLVFVTVMPDGTVRKMTKAEVRAHNERVLRRCFNIIIFTTLFTPLLVFGGYIILQSSNW